MFDLICHLQKYSGDLKNEESIWRNPFDIQYFGIEESYARYEDMVRNNDEMIKKLKDLENKVLGCWYVFH